MAAVDMEDLGKNLKTTKKKAFVEECKINRAYDQEVFLEKEMGAVSKITDADYTDVFATFGDIFIENYVRTYEHEVEALAAAVPFICDSFDHFFKLVPGQLITVAAYTGRGKSTAAVNVAATYIQAGKRPFIISNEESSKDMFDMIACALEGINHKGYAERTLDELELGRVGRRVKSLIKKKQLFVMDHEMSKGATTKAEAVLEMLKIWNTASVKPDIVIIDYLTNIYSAGSTTADNHYYQLERFLTELKNLLNTVSFPIIMNAQMHSDDKKKGTSLDAKLIMGGAIQRYSTIVIEVRTDYDTGYSDYVIHKNRRFKKVGMVSLKYDNGRMRKPLPNEVRMSQRVKDAAEARDDD
jgi:replicative DNA helicase